jgi:hypothetical protein
MPNAATQAGESGRLSGIRLILTSHQQEPAKIAVRRYCFGYLFPQAGIRPDARLVIEKQWSKKRRPKSIHPKVIAIH